VARFWLSNRVARAMGTGFPWGTLVVNVCGCGLIGALAAMLGAPSADTGAHPTVWAWLAIGLIGSFTTVSSFSLQTMDLLMAGQTGRALVNVIASLGLCLASVGAAFALTLRVLS
jgi:fluoride exporter